MYDRPENFGKELGLLHQIIVEGRKLNLGREWWKQFLDPEVLRKVAEFLSITKAVPTPILRKDSFREILESFPGRYDVAIRPQDIAKAWWVPDRASEDVVLPMHLFKGCKLESEEDARSALERANLRPANTLELISFSRALRNIFGSYATGEIDVPVEEGIRNHVVALDARRIDGKEQNRCLGVDVSPDPRGTWFLHTYTPENSDLWQEDPFDTVLLLATPID